MPTTPRTIPASSIRAATDALGLPPGTTLAISGDQSISWWAGGEDDNGRWLHAVVETGRPQVMAYPAGTDPTHGVPVDPCLRAEHHLPHRWGPSNRTLCPGQPSISDTTCRCASVQTHYGPWHASFCPRHITAYHQRSCPNTHNHPAHTWQGGTGRGIRDLTDLHCPGQPPTPLTPQDPTPPYNPTPPTPNEPPTPRRQWRDAPCPDCGTPAQQHTTDCPRR